MLNKIIHINTALTRCRTTFSTIKLTELEIRILMSVKKLFIIKARQDFIFIFEEILIEY